MQKNYAHNEYEDALYAGWEQSGAMRADASSSRPPFTIPLPPPNVTGTLHLGHAMMLAVEDILIRYKKMTGHEALWIPGTDHAAIATETKVLQVLGIEDRKQMTREDFITACKRFAAESQETIITQCKKMGAWLDWSRLAYTLDDPRNTGVIEMFNRLYRDGLLYRGYRMINWSVDAESVISDDEVVWEDREETLYYIRCGDFIIATVRPETKCWHSPVVVSPHDGRYKHLIGTSFTAETYAGERTFWVVGDEHIDPEFGSGCMTISTLHDLNDYEMASRHGWDRPQADENDSQRLARELGLMTPKIGFDGKMTAAAGLLEGLTVTEARRQAVEIMRQKGLILKEEPYTHGVPLCSRTGCVIEPMVSQQWFIDVHKEFLDAHTGQKTTLQRLTLDAVKEGHVTVIPERFEKIYYHWIENLRDWCISRQIWWGHRIPVWYDAEGAVHLAERIDGEYRAPSLPGLTQDEDTLDTWFSSGIWPISTLGWPDAGADFTQFYPNAVLETGHDIIFNWVARMILMCRYATGVYPFHTTYLHGMVVDERGKKMSKSKGNGIDPLEVIAQYGADAVRLSLVIGSTPGQALALGESKIQGYRHFTNKLWNASRFVQLQLGDTPVDLTSPLAPQTLTEQWITHELSAALQSIAQSLEAYRISEAGDTMYHFVWGTFCKWFIELSKRQVRPTFLAQVLEHILRMVHPLCPFISEVCYREVFGRPAILCTLPYPVLDYSNPHAAEQFQHVQTIVTDIRRIRAERNIAPSQTLGVRIVSHTLLEEEALASIRHLGRLSSVKETVSDDHAAQYDDVQIVLPMASIYLRVPVDTDAERERLTREITRTGLDITSLQARLSNAGYTANAPAHLVAETRQQLQQAQATLQTLRELLASL
ncbi:valine--tRNA ligase [Candidatus Peribacteria bacterium]|nr:valine--tRNA ligase [Candidatus Peribacteria bacterium]